MIFVFIKNAPSLSKRGGKGVSSLYLDSVSLLLEHLNSIN